MNGKKRYIPIVALGALLLSLLAILPVAGAGEVGFIDPGDINDANTGALDDTTPDDQEWARQGGQLGILLDDSDINASVKRVLLPFVDTEVVGTANITANSNVFTIARADRIIPSLGILASSNIDASLNADIGETVERDDLIMVGYETLRKVTKVEFVDRNTPATERNTDDDDVKVTLDRAYHSSAAGSAKAIHRVKQTYVESSDSDYDAFDGDGYKTLASGLRTATAAGAVTVRFRADPFDFTEFTLDRDVVDSGVGSHGGRLLEHRLKSAVSRGVRDDDLLLVRLDGLNSSATADPLLGIDEQMLTYATPGDARTAITAVAGVGASVSGTSYTIANLAARGTFSATITGVTDNSGSDEHDVSAVPNAYILFWSSEENDTGSSVTVKSRARQDAVPLALRETTSTSGEFAAKIDLVPNEVMVRWAAIPYKTPASGGDPAVEYAAGDTVTLRRTLGPSNAAYTVEGYSALMVKYPRATRPDDGDHDPNDTGTDEVKVETVTDFSQLIPRLPVEERDTITVRHPDDTRTITVETTGPSFSAFSPGHDSAARDSRPELSAQVVDSDSGLKDSDIDFIYTVDDGSVNTVDPSEDGYTDEVNNGFTVRARVVRVGDNTDRVIKWWVKAKDKAGNVAYSDRLPNKDGEPDTCVATTDEEATASDSTCDPHIITVDNTIPDMLRAETGRHWDTSLSTGDSEDKTEYRASEASKTSILVIFNEHLDRGSVQATDFEVNDAAPQSADVENVTVRDDSFQTYAQSGATVPTGSTSADDDPDTGDGNKAIAGDEVEDEGDKRGYVFLTVSELTSNAKPKVELVGNVEDIAGNRRSSDAVPTATDRIGPSLTVTFSGGDRPVTNKDVTLTVTSDEDIGRPDVYYARVKSTKVEDGESVQLLDAEREDAVVSFRSAKEYQVKITPPSDGLYTVYVEAEDSADGNPGAAGDKDTRTANKSVEIDVDDDTTAILFERDKSVAKPDLDPGPDGVQTKFETDDRDGYLTIDYSAEASEYYKAGDKPMVCNQQVHPANCDSTDIDSDTPGNQAPDKAAVTADDLDTYGRIDVLTATLDGEDISGDLIEDDDNVFLYRLSDLEEDREYKLAITVEDAAGNRNVAPHEGTVKVIKRKPYKLELRPGWNLVSLPGQPADTDVNAVIPADHPIDAIRTYDRASGGWIFAEDDGEGRFIGPLVDEDIGFTANNAYMLRTDSTQALEVDIPKIPAGAAVFLPTINIEQGWNLVPIVDPDGDFKLDEQTAEDNYFSGLAEATIAEIYTHDLKTNRWKAVKEHEVQIGKGYWVYATKPGVIVP